MTDFSDFDAMDPVTGLLDLSLWFVRKDTSPPPQSFPVSGSAGALTRGLLLANLTQADRDNLDSVLSADFSAFFDNAWQKRATK